MKRIAIYLAGNIKKSHEVTGEDFWTDNEKMIILDALSPHPADFLNPAYRKDDKTDNEILPRYTIEK